MTHGTTIVSAEAWLVDLEVETKRTDAVQAFLKQETVFVSLTTADGMTGFGYSYTVGQAESFNVTVAPHFLIELHLSLGCATPNALCLEHIPQLRAVTTSEITLSDGAARAPEALGLGIDWDLDHLDDARVA